MITKINEIQTIEFINKCGDTIIADGIEIDYVSLNKILNMLKTEKVTASNNKFFIQSLIIPKKDLEHFNLDVPYKAKIDITIYNELSENYLWSLELSHINIFSHNNDLMREKDYIKHDDKDTTIIGLEITVSDNPKPAIISKKI